MEIIKKINSVSLLFFRISLAMQFQSLFRPLDSLCKSTIPLAFGCGLGFVAIGKIFGGVLSLSPSLCLIYLISVRVSFFFSFFFLGGGGEGISTLFLYWIFLIIIFLRRWWWWGQ